MPSVIITVIGVRTLKPLMSNDLFNFSVCFLELGLEGGINLFKFQLNQESTQLPKLGMKLKSSFFLIGKLKSSFRSKLVEIDLVLSCNSKTCLYKLIDF